MVASHAERTDGIRTAGRQPHRARAVGTERIQPLVAWTVMPTVGGLRCRWQLADAGLLAETWADRANSAYRHAIALEQLLV